MGFWVICELLSDVLRIVSAEFLKLQVEDSIILWVVQIKSVYLESHIRTLSIVTWRLDVKTSVSFKILRLKVSWVIAALQYFKFVFSSKIDIVDIIGDIKCAVYKFWWAVDRCLLSLSHLLDGDFPALGYFVMSNSPICWILDLVIFLSFFSSFFSECLPLNHGPLAFLAFVAVSVGESLVQLHFGDIHFDWMFKMGLMVIWSIIFYWYTRGRILIFSYNYFLWG